MKTIILSSFAIILSLFSTQAQAQEKHETEKRNYIVLTRKIPQLKPIILTAKSLAEEDGHHFGDFQVVVCGKTVSGLQDKEKMAPYLEMAEEAGVHIKACGFSLKKFETDPDKLPKEIEVVKNGLLHNFRLQKKGYLSIEL
ncbi:DsrE family protein [Salegentibacter chungangensis]|uniref:Sulfur reduction protein DsrE n=1 Tax=Salegentibacter chungangensis TaxID=1335724 RepID=A0ABW3NTN1_9FLAO